MQLKLNKVNWREQSEIIELCRRLGAGNCVIKHRDRPNYNITHYERAMHIVDHKRILLVYVCTEQNEIA